MNELSLVFKRIIDRFGIAKEGDEATCRDCRGRTYIVTGTTVTGDVITRRCETCHGLGYVCAYCGGARFVRFSTDSGNRTEKCRVCCTDDGDHDRMLEAENIEKFLIKRTTMHQEAF